jgi:hypothetical protein
MRPPRRTPGHLLYRLVCTVARVLLLLAPWGLSSERAAAQACHAGSFVGPPVTPRDAAARPLALGASLGASAARYATRSYVGEYQALVPGLSVISRYASADLVLPVYRIVRNGLRDAGVGDLALGLRVPVLDAPTRGLSAGVALATTLPTGSADKQLGMGHVMLMPGAYLRLDTPALVLVVQLAYGRALGGMGAHAMHVGPQPIVNPMNRSELEHAFSASVRVVDGLRALVRLYGATPAWDQNGEAREVLALGGQATAGPVDVRLELELPLVGSPFAQRLVLAVGARF